MVERWSACASKGEGPAHTLRSTRCFRRSCLASLGKPPPPLRASHTPRNKRGGGASTRGVKRAAEALGARGRAWAASPLGRGRAGLAGCRQAAPRLTTSWRPRVRMTVRVSELCVWERVGGGEDRGAGLCLCLWELLALCVFVPGLGPILCFAAGPHLAPNNTRPPRPPPHLAD